MQINKIKLYEYYRHKDHPDFCWAKPIAILKPGENGNTSRQTVIKCEWSTSKNSYTGLIKYFRPSVLVEPKEQPNGQG